MFILSASCKQVERHTQESKYYIPVKIIKFLCTISSHFQCPPLTKVKTGNKIFITIYDISAIFHFSCSRTVLEISWVSTEVVKFSPCKEYGTFILALLPIIFEVC